METFLSLSIDRGEMNAKQKKIRFNPSYRPNIKGSLIGIRTIQTNNFKCQKM